MSKQAEFVLIGRKRQVDTDELHNLPSNSFLQDAWQRLKRNRSAVIALGIIGCFVVIALLTILVTPYPPNQANTNLANLPPKIPGIGINGLNGKMQVAGELVDKYEQLKVPKGSYYVLGTDYMGRDILSRILVGLRLSLMIAFVATLIDVLIGVGIGLLSGLSGGRLDLFLQRVLEVLSGIPNLVIMILMLTILKPGMLTIIITMAISNWIGMARITRAQTLKLKQMEYVLAAQTLGANKWQIAIKHILPNISSVIIVQMMFSMPAAIFFEAFLSFIGLGIAPPDASLGTLLSDGYKNFRFLPFQMWSPAIVLSVIMIAFNLLADGLRDALDPRTKG